MINYSIVLRTANSNAFEINQAKARIATAKANNQQPSAEDEALVATEIKKAYAQAQYNEVMNLQAFARHIATHGCVYSRADIVAILTMAVDCLREQLLAGQKIQLGDLGSFYLSLNSKGADSAKTFNPTANITSVNVNWEQSREFKNLIDEAEWNLVASRVAQAAVVKAIKAGETIVDLSKPMEDDPSGNDNDPSGGGDNTPSGGGTPTGGGSGSTGTNTPSSGSGSGSNTSGTGSTSGSGSDIDLDTTTEPVVLSINGKADGETTVISPNTTHTVYGANLKKLTAENFVNSEGKICTFNPIVDNNGMLMYSGENALSTNPQTIKVVVDGKTIFTINCTGK